jgi:hypothetical protein
VTGPAAERDNFKKQATMRQDRPVDESKYAKLSPEEAAASRLADELAKEKAEPTVLSFSAFKPIPEEKRGDWYDWNCVHWGTKWDAAYGHLTETKSSLVYGFETAWSPPEPAVLEMSKQYPKLKFNLRFYEGGMGFQGKLIAKAGEVIESEDKEYSGCRGG